MLILIAWARGEEDHQLTGKNRTGVYTALVEVVEAGLVHCTSLGSRWLRHLAK